MVWPILVISLILLGYSLVQFARTDSYEGSSFSRDLYCGTFRFIDQTCDMNNNWVAKDTTVDRYILVKGTDSTAILDIVGARTVLRFGTGVATPSNPITCVQGADGVDGEQGETGATGDKGEPGATGAAGICTVGDTGPAGPAGAQGIQGIQGVQGIQGIQGIPGTSGFSNAYLGVFDSRITQTVPSTSTATPMFMENTISSRGVSVVEGPGDPSGRPSYITFANNGIYNIQFSSQLYHQGGAGSGKNMFIWLRHNGVDVPYSATDVSVDTNTPHVVAAWNFVVEALAGQTYQLMWSSDNIHIQMPVYANQPPVPGIPSVILTVTQVGA